MCCYFLFKTPVFFSSFSAKHSPCLRLNKKLRGFPLVDSPTQMVLLGSVQRTELINAIEKHIGKEKYDATLHFPLSQA